MPEHLINMTTYGMHDNEDHLPLPCDYRNDNTINPRISRDKKNITILMVILYWIFLQLMIFMILMLENQLYTVITIV